MDERWFCTDSEIWGVRKSRWLAIQLSEMRTHERKEITAEGQARKCALHQIPSSCLKRKL